MFKAMVKQNQQYKANVATEKNFKKGNINFI